jgi:hypothetical protein
LAAAGDFTAPEPNRFAVIALAMALEHAEHVEEPVQLLAWL